MKIIVKCNCGKEFETKQSRIDIGRGKFCSIACKYKYYKKKSGYKCIKHKENLTSFVKGQIPWNKGKKGLQIGSKKCKGLHLSPETEFKKGQLKEEKNINWAGNNVGYHALHSYISRRLGKANSCCICNKKDAKIYVWHNISGLYIRDLSDWESLCQSCHLKLHSFIRRQKLEKIC